MKILMGGGLLLGVALAQATPLAGYELQLALQRLEESTMPVQVFRERVAALTAGQAHYPPEVQGRLARLQCWAQPSERDEEFRRAVAFAEQGRAGAGPCPQGQGHRGGVARLPRVSPATARQHGRGRGGLRRRPDPGSPARG